MSFQCALVNGFRTVGFLGLSVLFGMSSRAAWAQTGSSEPALPPGEIFVVTDEAVINADSTWAPDPPSPLGDERFTRRLNSRISQSLSREVIFDSSDSAVVRYTRIESEPGTGAETGFDPGLRSGLLTGSYKIRKTGDAVSSTKEDGGAFDATEASFLRGDFLGLLAWRALRESISAASLRPGQTFELTGPSVLGLFGSTLPLATRAVLTLRQVPAAGESAFFEIVTDLAPESSGAESHSLRGTARIDLSTTRIEVRLSEDRTEKTKIEFTDREVVAKHHRDIEIRRTIERPETPTGG